MTPLYDSLIFAAKFIEQRCPRDCRGDVGPDNVRSDNVRPVLILFSDGIDTMSLHSPREALAAIVASGAYVYCVDIGKSGRPGMGSGFLWRLSDATGGRYFSLSATAHDSAHGDAASILNAALDDLRASYVVTFALPTRQQGFHSVRLMPTRNLNLTFHSRNGYYYEPGLR